MIEVLSGKWKPRAGADIHDIVDHHVFDSVEVTITEEWQMNDLSVKRERIRNVPSIEELRKSGFRVSVRHFRCFEDYYYMDIVYMTKTLYNNAKITRAYDSYKIQSHGGWTILDVTTMTGRDVSVRYNVPSGHQFDRKRAIRACLGKLIKELGK